MKIQNKIGYGFAFLAAMCFGSIGTLSRLLNQQGLSIISTTIITSIGFIIVGLIYGIAKNFKVFKISLRALILCAIYGAVMNYFSKVFYLKSIEVLPVAICSTIMFTMVFPTMFASKYLFKESITPLKIVLSIIALGGVVLALNVFTGGTYYPLLAVFLITFTTLLCATMNLSSNYLLKRGYSAIVITFYGNLSLFAVLLFAQAPVESIKNIGQVALLNITFNVPIMILLSTATVGSILFFINSLKYISITDATILLAFDPITSTILGLLIFGERLSPLQLLGGGIIIISVIGVSLSDNISVRFITKRIKKKAIV